MAQFKLTLSPHVTSRHFSEALVESANRAIAVFNSRIALCPPYESADDAFKGLDDWWAENEADDYQHGINLGLDWNICDMNYDGPNQVAEPNLQMGAYPLIQDEDGLYETNTERTVVTLEVILVPVEEGAA